MDVVRSPLRRGASRLTRVLLRRALVLLAVALISAGAAGCAQALRTEDPVTPTPSPTRGIVLQSLATPSPTATPGAPPMVRPIPYRPSSRSVPVTPAMGTPLDDARVAEVLALMAERDPDPAALEAALDEIVAKRDVRFVVVLIDLLRLGPMQIARLTGEHLQALAALTGISAHQTWNRWVEWYGLTSLQPPPSYAAWKGALLGHLEPSYEAFLAGTPADGLRIEQVLWSGSFPGGPGTLDAPAMVRAFSADAAYLTGDEPVIGVVIEGEPRAYPLRIMDVHEVVNDHAGDRPFSLVYSILTGSAFVLNGRGPDGEVYAFDTSGLLYQSTPLLVDRRTGTLWTQFDARPVLGPLVPAAEEHGAEWLERTPVVIARWADWLSAHPDTLVLDAETGTGRTYLPGMPHIEYQASGNTNYPVSGRDMTLVTREWVYGVTVEGAAAAVPLRDVLRERVVHVRPAGRNVVLVGDGRRIRVHGISPLIGEIAYWAGGAVRAYDAPPRARFQAGVDPATLVDEEGRVWDVTESGLVAPDGTAAPRVFGQLAYWFAWHAFHPNTTVLTFP